MEFKDYDKYHGALSLPEDASLQELDETYFNAVEYWTVQGRRGAENAKRQLQLIDEAYGALFERHLKDQEGMGYGKANYTMQQVVNGQERMTKPSEGDEDLWIPPRRARSASPEMEDGMEIDEVQEYEKTEQPTVYQSDPAPGFVIREIKGDIKDAPDRAVIVHAVNCQGVWGYGMAKELKNMVRLQPNPFWTLVNYFKCPAAFETYRLHCQRASRPYSLVGTCLLIPPQPSDYEQERKLRLKGLDNSFIREVPIPKPRHWIGCLFTSTGYGKRNMKTNNPGKDSPSQILNHTRFALEEFRTRLEDYDIPGPEKVTASEADDDKPGEIWSAKFNSGAFGVDWELTRDILVEEFDNSGRQWTLLERISSGGDDALESANWNVSEGSGFKHSRRHSQIENEDRPKTQNDEAVEGDLPLRDALREMGFH
ncbi:hypothetical protein G647_08667 [Cladophialophora carrionii CBS 160.54]|uniref:ADP-ribose 1''-phosphate phosphatase n=1 Tax=Cladophialophora carrionii CBS 160.54 TaxID=1279043 RepID=V9CYC8_9EURO|nr:uncharacterized protein G647_08667 [Cladophialophora carrionii CBS 160.54]ETI19655.1 hypothetical protein G647_08667 [Cladophialophora carrionii CBS 160.54]